MKILKRLASTLFGVSLFFAPAVRANFDEHEDLIDTLHSHGIHVLLNDITHCKEKGISGLYNPYLNLMVVCQDNRSPITDSQVEWTDNDLDTLRHEAHHVLQDCIAGIDNEEMELLFEYDKLKPFVKGILSQQQIRRIIRSYGGAGATRAVVERELEAFAVASLDDPARISNALNQLCES